MFFGDVGHGVHPEGKAGIVYEERTTGQLGGEAVDRCGIGHVQFEGATAAFVRDLLDPIETASAEDDVETLVDEPDRRRSADPRRRSGHDRGSPWGCPHVTIVA
jgi:hypothetical protein